MNSFELVNVKLFGEYQLLLREQLNTFLSTLHPLIRKDVIRALGEPGKLLSPVAPLNSTPPAGMWSLLPFLVAQYVDPNVDKRQAAIVAVSVECFICALDLLDDVEDEDQTAIVKEIGVARILNVSTALLALTNHLLLTLTQAGFPQEQVVHLINTIQTSLITAVEAQHRDILAEQRTAESFTTEECIEISEGKAGSLIRLACLMGALYAGASDEIVSQFSELGRLLGIAHQLDNDSRDMYDILRYQQTNEQSGTVKTDVARQKKTLPVVLAAHAISVLRQSASISKLKEQRVWVDVLHEGIMTTRGISLLYREHAYEQLQQIEAQRPISHALRLLLGFA